MEAAILKGELAGEVEKLKEQPGKRPADLRQRRASTKLTRHGLIDEYRLMTTR